MLEAYRHQLALVLLLLLCVTCLIAMAAQHLMPSNMNEECNAAEGSLTRTESGNERLRQEADASRAEIWRKIQAAKLNNSKRHQVWAVLSSALL